MQTAASAWHAASHFQGARYLDLDRARLLYQWEFGLDWQISDADGVQEPSIPLAAIEVDIFKAPVAPGDVPPAVVAAHGRAALSARDRWALA